MSTKCFTEPKRFLASLSANIELCTFLETRHKCRCLTCDSGPELNQIWRTSFIAVPTSPVFHAHAQFRFGIYTRLATVLNRIRINTKFNCCWLQLVLLILDGRSEHVAHIWSKSGIPINWKRLVTSTERANLIFFSQEKTNFSSCVRDMFWVTI